MTGSPHNPDVGRVPPHGDVVGRVPSRGVTEAGAGSLGDVVGRVPSHGEDVGRVPPRGAQGESLTRRLRRLHRVWPDRDGNISYLLTICVDGRARVLDNEDTFQRLVDFLLDGPQRYRWFGRRFVIMPDHIHLIAHMGYEAVRLGQWIKALKAVVGGLEPRNNRPVGAPGLQDGVGRVPPRGEDVGPVPSPGAGEGRLLSINAPPPSTTDQQLRFARIPRSWRWQVGFHDHKLRTRESETRKWEYVCLNPVRYHLVRRPEEWPFGGEIFYEEVGGPFLVRGTPPLLETGILIEPDGTPREGTRPTT